MINLFWGNNAFLSNFMMEGKDNLSVEHRYQAAKTLDENERLTILALQTPGQAKRAGAKVTLRPDWEEVKDDIMINLLRKKFQDRRLADRLVFTANHELVEGNTWHDNVWGSCTCNRCKEIVGENRLGKMLMVVRDEIKTRRSIDAYNTEC